MYKTTEWSGHVTTLFRQSDDRVAVMTKQPPLASSERRKKTENVLILQGGGSLGAFGCGVFKALAKRNIKIDIVAGTSIGGVNAAIIAGGGKNGESPKQSLERFWMELSD